jgi:hypothetical protein
MRREGETEVSRESSSDEHRRAGGSERVDRATHCLLGVCWCLYGVLEASSGGKEDARFSFSPRSRTPSSHLVDPAQLSASFVLLLATLYSYERHSPPSRSSEHSLVVLPRPHAGFFRFFFIGPLRIPQPHHHEPAFFIILFIRQVFPNPALVVTRANSPSSLPLRVGNA